MKKRLLTIMAILTLFSSIGMARRNAIQQVFDLDYNRKLWLYNGVSTAYLQYDTTNSEIDCPANFNISGTLINSGKMRISAGTSQSAVQASSAIVVTAPLEIIVATGTITLTTTPAISTATATYPEGSFVTIRVSSSSTYGGNSVTFADGDGFDLWGANKTLNLGDEMDLQLYQITGASMEWHLKQIRDAAGDIIMANEETLTNATNGRIDCSGNFRVTGGTLDLGNASRTIADDGVNYDISISTDVDIEGDLTVTGNNQTFGNGATIDNATSATELNITETEIIMTGAVSIDSFVTMADSGTVTTSSATVIIASKATSQEITLPAVATSQGKIFIVKKTGAAGTVTLTTNGSETIDGANGNTDLDAQYEWMFIICDGSVWHIIGGNY